MKIWQLDMGFYENIVHKFRELPIAMLDGVVVSDRVMECGRELVDGLSEWPLTYKMSRQLGFTPATFRNAQNSLGPQLFFPYVFTPTRWTWQKRDVHLP